MNVILEKYKDEYILMNDFSTWPKSWCILLEENREKIEQYISRDKEIAQKNQDKESEDYEPEAVNEYKYIKDYIQEKFAELFYSEAKELLCYHETRLMDYEVENIKNEGLNHCCEDFINNKIDNLYKQGIIDDIERDLLQRSNVLTDVRQLQIRKNKLYFVFGYQDIRSSDDNLSVLNPFLLSYGGESIFRYFDRALDNSPKKELLEKLNSLSKPYIVICKSKTQELEDRFGEQFFDTIIIHYIENEPNEISNEFYTLQANVRCLDIVEVDENSILE